MKRILAILALAAGCSSPSPTPADETAFEMALATQLAFDASRVKTGESVLYSVRLRGAPQPEYYQWAAVGEEGSAIWIENRRPGAPNPFPMVVKAKFDRSGKLLEQWIGEPGGVPAKVYPNPRRTEPAEPRRDSTVAGVTAQEEPDALTIDGKTYACTKVTTTLTYPDGRRSTMVNWLSPEVPFPVLVDGKSRGGLVRRQIGRLSVDLLNARRDAKPELTIPK